MEAASRTSVPGRRLARAKARAAVEREVVLDAAVAEAAGTGDHTRGRVIVTRHLHVRIWILIIMMLIAAFRLAKEIFSTVTMCLKMSGHYLGWTTLRIQTCLHHLYHHPQLRTPP